MTVIRPNSVAGINSITVQSGNSLSVHKANGELIRTLTSNSGVTTFSSISVGTATTDNSAAKSINIGLGASISQHTDNTLSFGTRGDERARIDSSGRLIIGHTASVGEARSVQVVGTNADTSSIQLIRHSANSAGAKLDLTKSRNATKGSNTIVQDDDNLGDIAFRADDGTDFNTEAARISAAIDGTPGANDIPGRLMFLTTADGANTPTERVRITSTGSVGIGSDSPTELLDIGGNTTIASNGRVNIYRPTGTASNTAFQINSNVGSTDSVQFIVQAGGSVGVGTDAPAGGSPLHINGGAASDKPHLRITADRGLVARLGDTSGSAQAMFDLYDPSDGSTQIVKFISGGADNFVNTGGQLAVGSDSASSPLHVKGNTGAQGITDYQVLTLQTASTDGAANTGAGIMFLGHDGSGGAFHGTIRCLKENGTSSDRDSYMSFGTRKNGEDIQEHLRIDSDGDIRTGNYGTLFGQSGFTLAGSSGSGGPQAIIARDSADAVLIVRRGTDGDAVEFRKDWGAGGSISVATNSVTYNTSSDYRLKENIVPITDGITRLKTLKPSRFNWIGDTSSTRDGFIAHEVTAVPEAISGTKDETHTEDDSSKNIKAGDPKYQGIDQAKLVPLLTAALQEAITKIETLETKVAALEGG